jgi:hypothetical protein
VSPRLRSALAWTLVVLAALVLLVSSLTLWVKRQVVSTPRWTDAAGRMLQDSRVRDAVSVYLVNELYARVDVAAELKDRLPDQFKNLAPVAAGVLHEFGTHAADAVLGQSETIELWKDANRAAHSELVSAIRGDAKDLVATNGDIVLDLRPILKRFEDSMLGQKIGAKLPADAGHVVVMHGNQVEAFRKGAKLLRAISLLAAIAIFVFWGAALWLSRARRRTLLAVGLSIFTVGLLLLVARHLTGNYLISALTTDHPDVQPAAAAVWGITTELLWFSGLAAIGYGIVIALAAMLAGPARWAVAGRRLLAPLLARAPAVAFGAVVAVCLFLLLFGPLDWARLISDAVLLVSGLAGVELLRRQTRRELR